MTGIERLRAIAGAWDEWGLGGTLAEMADEIERELREERDRWDDDLSEAQVSWNAVAGVMLDMERHCLGHEGVEDSPVARWARELREALKSDTSDGRGAQNPSWHDPADAAGVTSGAAKVTRDHAEDVSMSAYDLLPADERDAIAWVREHGGLDRVREEWNHSRNLKRQLEKAQAKVERQQRHIEFVQGKCSERQEHIVELNKMVSDMRLRLMPEGCDEEFIKLHMSNLWGFMFDVMDRLGVDKSDSDAPEIVFDVLDRRLMPEGMEWMLWDDGKPVTYDDAPDDVIGVYLALDGSGYVLMTDLPDQLMSEPGERVRRPAVLAADGEPLKVGKTVWDTNGDELVIGALENGGHTVTCRYADVGDGIPTHGMWSPSDLTHQRPVFDADGVPIKVGDTVWPKYPYEEPDRQVESAEVVFIHRFGRIDIQAKYATGMSFRQQVDAKQLTHTKPEIDSWERVEEDVMVDAKDYCESRGISSEYPKHSGKAKCEDLVRRCRALAERERGEA